MTATKITSNPTTPESVLGRYVSPLWSHLEAEGHDLTVLPQTLRAEVDWAFTYLYREMEGVERDTHAVRSQMTSHIQTNSRLSYENAARSAEKMARLAGEYQTAITMVVEALYALEGQA